MSRSVFRASTHEQVTLGDIGSRRKPASILRTCLFPAPLTFLVVGAAHRGVHHEVPLATLELGAVDSPEQDLDDGRQHYVGQDHGERKMRAEDPLSLPAGDVGLHVDADEEDDPDAHRDQDGREGGHDDVEQEGRDALHVDAAERDRPVEVEREVFWDWMGIGWGWDRE